ncbi:hypothetical protein MRB53_016482 [Persea americana]|uniref:Uncharacterized protein n=1 Tax=Persea americana TaxID=3435 RepID=A0ACC2M2A1_PERAE|nr:hypothetical protein MRB53_016482 [Persea americana]
MAGGEKEKDEKNVDDLDCIILEFDPLENICPSFEEEAFHRRQTLSRRRRPFNHLRTRPGEETPQFFFGQRLEPSKTLRHRQNREMRRKSRGLGPPAAALPTTVHHSWLLFAAHGLAIGPAASWHQSPSGAGNMVVGENFWPPCIIEWLAAWWLVGRGKLTAGNVRVLAAGIRKGSGV